MRSGKIYKTPTLGEKFRMEQGIEIGRRARELYPDGILIEHTDTPSALIETKNLIDNPNILIIFEATFSIDNFVAKADILKRKSDGWHMIEVKSNVNNKDEFIDDMAYTTMVIEHSGLNISNVSLMLISKDFQLGMENKKLFAEIDHTDNVIKRVEELKRYWTQIEEITRKSEKPELNLLYECHKCKLFKDCMGKNIEHHIFELPHLSKSNFEKLTQLGINCIENIPDKFPLTENQERVKICVQAKKPFVGNKLKNELESISWPAFYLDFETVSTAIPLYPDIFPYTKLLTQYSIHKCSKLGHIVNHSEYLARPSRDCRKKLTEHLIYDLKGEGSIIVYSNFEKVIIKNLIKVCPEFSNELNSLIERLADLEAIIRNSFYQSSFHGRTSIKKTLPALVDNMSYGGMEISNGDSAMAVFGLMALGKYENREAKVMRKKLLDYCKQDTLAIVKLHERLVEYV